MFQVADLGLKADWIVLEGSDCLAEAGFTFKMQSARVKNKSRMKVIDLVFINIWSFDRWVSAFIMFNPVRALFVAYFFMRVSPTVNNILAQNILTIFLVFPFISG